MRKLPAHAAVPASRAPAVSARVHGGRGAYAGVQFERSPQNVERAVREQGLEYPVGLDNDYVAWNAYGNRYWPTLYLIDRVGQVRYTQIGEGNYDRTEAAIRALLHDEDEASAGTVAS